MRRSTRVLRLVAALVVVAALVAVAVVVVERVVLAPPPGPATLPTPLAELTGSWRAPIQLPESLPACLRYDANAATIAPEDTAQGGWALLVRLAGASRSGCQDWGDADVLITEAPALGSLPGDVTTVTANRLEFARVAAAADSGQTRLTLQWRCRDVMCRLSGTLGGPVTENALTQLAASFQPAEP